MGFPTQADGGQLVGYHRLRFVALGVWEEVGSGLDGGAERVSWDTLSVRSSSEDGGIGPQTPLPGPIFPE